MYDAEKCFDSLWAQDCINDLYNAGCVDDKLVLLYQGTQNANIAVKTPFGLSDRENIQNVIMQGGVFGSIMCTTSIDNLAKEVYNRPELLYKYKGVANVPPLLMVDDILTISKCSATASALNVTVNDFIESKKLKLNHKKCSVIHVGKKTGTCPDIKVHGETMHREESTDYLGDLFHASGKSKFNVIKRTAKAYAILAEIKAIITDIPLGRYKTEVGLQLRQAMFVNGVLYNSEVWQGLNTTDIAMLEHVDRQLLKFICSGHAKTATEFLYLETSALPLKYIIGSRRIMFLQNILKRRDEELVKRVYEAQKDKPTTGDFIELVKKDLEMIGQDFDEEFILSKTTSQFKSHIKKKTREAALKELKLVQLTHTKVSDIKYDKFQTQPYLKSNKFTNDMSRLLFNMRSSMTKNIKSNFSSQFGSNPRCSMKCNDLEAIDNQNHILQCQVLLEKLSPEEKLSASQVKYNDIFGSLEEQSKVVLVLARMLDIREEILEMQCLPVGIITGPATDTISF